MFAQNHVLAQLQLDQTDRDPASVFVRVHSGVAFLGGSDWDEQAVHAALVEFARPGLSTGQLGVGWKAMPGYSIFDGLWPLSVAVRGKYLIVSDSSALLGSMLDGMSKKPTSAAATYSAGFSHQSERENFVALAKLLDFGARSSASGEGPEFFSENIASLSYALRRISSEKIVIRDAGDRQIQTVVYAWAQ